MRKNGPTSSCRSEPVSAGPRGSRSEGKADILALAEEEDGEDMGPSSFFFFFFCHTHVIWKFLGQGLNPSHSYSVFYCCSNAVSLTYCTTVGTPLKKLFLGGQASATPMPQQPPQPLQRQCRILNRLCCRRTPPGPKLLMELPNSGLPHQVIYYPFYETI